MSHFTQMIFSLKCGDLTHQLSVRTPKKFQIAFVRRTALQGLCVWMSCLFHKQPLFLLKFVALTARTQKHFLPAPFLCCWQATPHLLAHASPNREIQHNSFNRDIKALPTGGCCLSSSSDKLALRSQVNDGNHCGGRRQVERSFWYNIIIILLIIAHWIHSFVRLFIYYAFHKLLLHTLSHIFIYSGKVTPFSLLQCTSRSS